MKNYFLDIKIVGGDKEINEMIQLLSKIEFLGRVGAHRTIPVEVDGDGTGRLRFEVIDENRKMELSKKLDIPPEIVSLGDLSREDIKFRKQVDDQDIDIHYIGG
jgi:hypothetical protein